MFSFKISYFPSVTLCIVLVLYIRLLNQNANLLTQYNDFRKQWSALSCECKGIDPTGGFCSVKDKYHVDNDEIWCKNLSQALRRLFHDQSVYDFGAGLGWYGKALLADDSDGYRVTQYEGFDEAVNIADLFPDGFVKYKDFSKPFYLPPKDWVLSFEVGQHIPVQYENSFIENLDRHNKKGVVLSWGLQGTVNFKNSRLYHLFSYISLKQFCQKP